MSEIPIHDLIGLIWFIVLWAGYTWYADRYARRRPSLRAVMHDYRYEWMQQMLKRDNRVVDVNILRNLLHGVAFFASATLLILAGLLTTLGSTDKAIEIVRALPFAAKTTLAQWELKLLVLSVIFVYAFFKFTWALRQFNYCSVLIGAAPPAGDDAYARRAAGVSTNASKDFNQGLRAYYFSLAALAWFVSPWVFVVATTLVVVVLYLREYRSGALRTLSPAGPE
ncbi:MAG: hypothetical protein A2150_00700 [Candidatus Muproteobacteria bacterium RBG_16_64_11]|uniref:DUF599 domain-containing protein n=1 Tax=Candidatus Muproteobacteria bacterium RBG_16_64_11 TaxID=1817758 RepID=A0A1F6TDX2_9PROT|nr:MAG: hypothetical protein A2150_00700 [Candidatus Muproteobacteria bacterium RBG_16_64_11]